MLKLGGLCWPSLTPGLGTRASTAARCRPPRVANLLQQRWMSNVSFKYFILLFRSNILTGISCFYYLLNVKETISSCGGCQRDLQPLILCNSRPEGAADTSRAPAGQDGRPRVRGVSRRGEAAPQDDLETPRFHPAAGYQRGEWCQHHPGEYVQIYEERM